MLGVDFCLNPRIFSLAVEKVKCNVSYGEQNREDRNHDECEIELVLAALVLAANVLPTAARLTVNVKSTSLAHAKVGVFSTFKVIITATCHSNKEYDNRSTT